MVTLTKVDYTEKPNQILVGLQSKPVYQGTVPSEVKAKRRAANKVAKQARKAHR